MRISVFIVGVVILLYACASPAPEIAIYESDMKLTSPAFSEGGEIPSEFTCDGANTNPQLDIAGVPANAKSLVLIMDDPDVPAAVRPERIWDHWVVFNIPPETITVPAGQNPPGVAGKNSGGKLAYGGPCPPPQYEPKRHRYFFKLYALDAMLDLPEGATKQQVISSMKEKIISTATLMGTYQRK
jgi:hypothetical protein